MHIIDLQHAIGTGADGVWGDKSRQALLSAFTNPAPEKLGAAEAQAFAARLGVSIAQLAAVATVESAGGGFDSAGHPKILFERHKFHALTGGRYSVCEFSNPQRGGYDASSWDKLCGAVATGEVDAAFMACSWGKFQVLGQYWSDFHYASPFELAHSQVASEAAHYELLCRYVEHFRLQAAMAAMTADPETCRAFAKAFNGPGYRDFDYHTKLAQAIKRAK